MKKINIAAGLLILLLLIGPASAYEETFSLSVCEGATSENTVDGSNWKDVNAFYTSPGMIAVNWNGFNSYTPSNEINNYASLGQSDNWKVTLHERQASVVNPYGAIMGNSTFGYFKYGSGDGTHLCMYLDIHDIDKSRLSTDDYTIVMIKHQDGKTVPNLRQKRITSTIIDTSFLEQMDISHTGYLLCWGDYYRDTYGNYMFFPTLNTTHYYLLESEWSNKIIVDEITTGFQKMDIQIIKDEGDIYGFSTSVVAFQDTALIKTDANNWNYTLLPDQYPVTVSIHEIVTDTWYNRTFGAPDPGIPGDIATVTINIRDARNDNLIPNSHITIKNMVTGQTVIDNKLLPTGTETFHLPKDTGFTLHQYLISATAGENYQDRGGFARVTGDMTINMDLQYIGDEAIDPESNTLLHVYVIDEGKGPASTAIVQVGELARLTGLDGKATFELPKNTQQSYTVSKDGYTPVSGSVDIGTEIEALNINIYRVTDKAAVTYQVRDARTGALIAGSTLQVKDVDADVVLVNETLPSGRGTFYLPKDPGYNPHQYLVTASGGGDYQDRGVFHRVTGSGTINVDLQYIGVDVDDPINNTLLHVYVWNTDSNGPSASTYVQVGSVARITNIEGYARFEVPKNSTQSYTVSRSGFSTVTGTVAIGTDPVVLNVDIARYIAPTPTPGPTQPGVPGDPSVPQVPQDHRDAAVETLRQAYAIVPQMFMLVLVLLLFGMIKRGMR